MAEVLKVQPVCDGVDVRVRLDDGVVVTFHYHGTELPDGWVERTVIRYMLNELKG